jgi:hypothetical protein
MNLSRLMSRMEITIGKKAIKREMKNVMPAFQFSKDDKMLIGYKQIRCHMVFDVKIGDLTRIKGSLLPANGNETNPRRRPHSQLLFHAIRYAGSSSPWLRYMIWIFCLLIFRMHT